MNQPMQVLTSHESHDWYTPPYYIELVRKVMGCIDLDPASDDLPQSWIQASEYWRENGLNKIWHGRVFCNPPYGKTIGQSNQSTWSHYMRIQYERGLIKEGILLINSTHGYKWYEDLWIDYPCCLLRDRIRFITPDGSQNGAAKRGQTFIYFGANTDKFSYVFVSEGRILLPERNR